MRAKKNTKSSAVARVPEPELLEPSEGTGKLVITPPILQALVSQLAGRQLADKSATGPYLKYAFEYFKIGSDLMHIFGNLELAPFTAEVVRKASTFPGAYFVFRGESLIYVGQSENIKRRLSSHLNGKSNFAIAVKQKYSPNDWRKFLAEHFSIHTWEQDDLLYLKQLEHVVIGVFKPPFNADVRAAA